MKKIFGRTAAKKLICIVLVIVTICSFGVTGIALDGEMEAAGSASPSPTLSAQTEEALPSDPMDMSPGPSQGAGPAPAGAEANGSASPSAPLVQSAEPSPAPDQDPAPQARGNVPELRVSLAQLGGAAKGFLSKQTTLFLEDMAADGNAFASAVLPSLYTATDMKINEILAVAQETLAAVQQVDQQVDDLTIKVDALYDAVNKGFAQGQFDAAAEKIDEAYLRVSPLWEQYTALVDGAETMNEAQRKAATEALMRNIYLTYGNNARQTFFSDLSLLHQAMYSASGRSTMIDGQIAYDKTVYPFEHQCVQGALDVYNYGASIQGMLLKLYQEYAAFVSAHPEDYTEDTQAALYPDGYNMGINDINTQAENCIIGDLMQPDEIETALTLDDHSTIDVFHVKSNDTGKEYMIEKNPFRVGDTVSHSQYASDGSDFYVYNYYTLDISVQSGDTRWVVPADGNGLMSLFPSDVTNPASWLAADGKLPLGQSDVILTGRVWEEESTEGLTNCFFVDHATCVMAHDASPLDPPEPVDLSSRDIYNGMAKQYAGRTEAVNMQETRVMRIFFDRNSGAAGIPKDEAGAYVPVDVTGMPQDLFLYDGDVLDLRGINSTDFGNRNIYASNGNVTIQSDPGKELSYLHLYVQGGVTLTAENLKLADSSDTVSLNGENTIVVKGEMDMGNTLEIKDAGLTLKADEADRYKAALNITTEVDGYGSDFLSIEYLNVFTGYMHTIDDLTLTATKLYLNGGDHDELSYVSGTFGDDSTITLTNGKVSSTKMTPYYHDGGADVAGKFPFIMKIQTGGDKNADTDSNIYFSMRSYQEWTGEVNITDMAGGDYFGKNGYDEIHPVADIPTYISCTEDALNMIRLRNSGNDKWQVKTITLSSPFWGDREVVLTIDDWIDDYEDVSYGIGQLTSRSHSLQSGKLATEIRGLEEGSVLSLLRVPRNTELMGEVLKALAESRGSLRLSMEDGVCKWTIDGRKITDPDIPMKLGVVFKPAKDSGISGLPEDALVLAFEHSGAFPAEMTLQFNAEQYGFLPGETLHLYWRGDDGKMEAHGTVTVDEEGFVELKLSHASSWILSRNKIAGAGMPGNPATGDGKIVSPYIALAAAATAALAGVALFLRRRRRGAR